MRVRTMILAAAALIVTGFSAGRLDSQEGVDPAKMQELMAKMMEAAQPGEEHEWLEELAGDWEITYTMRQMPGAPAATMRGTASGEMILGGRWLHQTMAGPMGESMSFIGYDRRHDEFVFIGLDAASTYAVTARGKKDEQTDKILLAGEDKDIIGKQVYTFDWEVKSADEQSIGITFTELGPMKYPDGFEMMRMDFKRKK